MACASAPKRWSRSLPRHARAHHAEEEARVFPALLRQGKAETTHLVHRLQQDHGWLEEDWLMLCPQLEALANGHSGFDQDVVRQGVEVFSALYLEHIELEDDRAYPQAREALGLRGTRQGQDERARRAALASA